MIGWLYRLLFGLLCLIFAEVIAWQNAADYAPADWLALFGIYSALGALLLDLITRARANSAITLLLVAGMFGIARALLTDSVSFDPDDTAAFVIDLVLIPLGAMPLACLLALGSFRLLLSGEASGVRVFGLAALAGFGWGIWLRGYPAIESVQAQGTSLTESGLIAGVVLAVWPWLARARPADDFDWRLMPYDVAAVGMVLGVTLLFRLEGGHIDALSGSILASLLVIILLMVVFTRNIRRADALPEITPPARPHLPGWYLLALPALAGGLFAWEIGGGNAAFVSSVLEGLLIFGVAWLPLVSALLGVTAMTRLTQEGY